jgi:hypothetical protein
MGVLILVGLWAAVCAQSLPPVSEPVVKNPQKTPVIFVPGVTGVELRDSSTGQIYWGKGNNLLRPRDRGYRIARPVRPGVGFGAIEAGNVILRLRVAGLLRKAIYEPLVDLFESNGYRLGNLTSPQPNDTFFLFAYDWRQDNVESARLLGQRLEHLRQVRGESELEVVLLCQSNGSHICRYFAKYRDANLEEAEAGIESDSRIAVSKLGLLGSSNGGSLRVLRELNRGRKYIQWIGRVWSPEALFTFLALYQDLPTYTKDLFLDDRGRALEIDLFDAANWKKYGWSIYGEESQQRLGKKPRDDLFGDSDERFEYLARSLNRAQRLHHLLYSDGPDLGAKRLYAVKNGSNPTPSRAVIRQDEGSWTTLFAGDRELQKLPVAESRITTPGDGHATLESQMWLSRQELSRLAWEPVDVAGDHFEMIIEPRAQEEILRILAD